MAPEQLCSYDSELLQLLRQEKERQRKSVNMIASENYVSKAVLQTLSCSLCNVCADGYPGSRHGHATDLVDQIESLCQKRALEAFDLDPKEWSVNVQPLSASVANFATFLGAVAPRGRIMGLDPPDGGHRTHGMYTKDKAIAATSMVFDTLPYKVDPETSLINYDELRRLALQFDPKLIIAALSEVGARINAAVFPAMQGTPHLNVIAATAVALKEAKSPEFREYQLQVLKNAKILSDTLKQLGYSIITGKLWGQP